MPFSIRYALAAPMMLALAACGTGGDTGTELPTAEAIAPIAAPEGQQWSLIAERTPEDGYRIGNPEAPIKVLEYASHTCPACARFSVEGHVRLEEYVDSGVVSYEIRNQVHNAIDLTLAMLMRCGGPDTFHPLANQVWGNLNEVMNRAQADQAALQAAMTAPPQERFQQIGQVAGLVDFFAARGISRDQSMQCLADTAEGQAIADRSNTQSDELGVTGTPTFFLNGRKLDNVAIWAALEPILQNAGAR